MKIEKNQTITIATIIILMFAASAAMVNIPTTKAALINTTMSVMFSPYVGVNSPTEIDWVPSPNLLATDQYYNATVQSYPWTTVPLGSYTQWPNATITFTDPNGVSTVKNGPFNVIPTAVGSTAGPRFAYIWTPTMQGNWTVTFYWPGDTTHAAITSKNQCNVGVGYAKRTVFAMSFI